MQLIRFVATAGVALQLAVLSPAAFTYFDTEYDTDWTSAGIGGLRGNGAGSISLAGISGSVTGAYLFWHGPTQTTVTTANATVMFNGSSVTGTNIGIAADNNWGYINSHAYRANVTSLVTGDGIYSLDGFMKDSGSININGASLYVTFDDGDSSNNRDLVLFNGNDSNQPSASDPAGWDVTLNGINYTAGSANLRLTVSDGQSWLDEAAYINGAELFAAGQNWAGDLGNPGTTNGSLWDEKTFSLNPFLDVGLNDIRLTTAPVNNDYLALIVAAVDLPAGAAPPPPPIGAVPEPSTYGLLGAAALALLMVRRQFTRR